MTKPDHKGKEEGEPREVKDAGLAAKGEDFKAGVFHEFYTRLK